MSDLRVQKLAQVLVQYSLELQPGENFSLVTSPEAEELSLAVYEEAIKAGANVLVENILPGMDEILFKFGSDEQIQHISPISKLVIETFDARLIIEAERNTRDLTNVDPAKIALRRRTRRALFHRQVERMATREYKWCMTVFPTHAHAQEADMSLREYQDFVYGAGLLDRPDPVAAWREETVRQQRWTEWLNGKDEITIQGRDVDLKMSIRGRTFKPSTGRENFPDGEIFTSPEEESVNGWVRFGYPAIYDGQEADDIELWFEDGKIVKEKAAKGQELLTSLLNSDAGARYLGELGIGVNYQIKKFTKNMLFDEKLGGTIHLAVGLAFPECGGKNQSGVHWDMLCNMAQSEMCADGEAFYRDGKFVI
jgi:aminopeptidase